MAVADEAREIVMPVSRSKVELTPAQRSSARRIILAQSCGKLADVASSAKTVLTWLMGTVGAPPALIGLLVPIRESGSMLPQALLSGFVKRAAWRKKVYAVGAVGQALCLAGMGVSALILDGATAGWAIVIALALHSLSRCLCSIASKDVLGKCVPKGARGSVSGIASSVAGLIGLAGAAAVMLGAEHEASKTFFAGLLFVGSALYLFAAAAIAAVNEGASTDAMPDNLVADLWRRIRMVWGDRVLRRFVITRTLLLGSALGSPYLVMLSRRHDSDLKSLAAFVFAGGLASALSSALWGKFSDRSSRNAMAAGGAVAAVTGFFGAAAPVWYPDLAANSWTWPGLFFLMGIGYEGVRIGRKTYVIDIAEGGDRTDYVSASNTVIAVAILVIGGFAALLNALGPAAALLLFSAMCLVGSLFALRLKCAAL